MFLSGPFRNFRKCLSCVVSLLMASCVVIACLSSTPSWARDTGAKISVIALKQLPRQARQTHSLIHSGGPFPYRKDGTAFGNRERLLPAQGHGFYREYTVPSPWLRDRGARRIVCGGRQRQAPDHCFYTDDHYASFSRIVQ